MNFLPISRENIEISMDILKKQGKRITFRNIMRQIGFSSDVLNYRTKIPTNELVEFELMLRASKKSPLNHFKLMDEKRVREEEARRETQREKIRKVARKAVEAIEKLIMDKLSL